MGWMGCLAWIGSISCAVGNTLGGAGRVLVIPVFINCLWMELLFKKGEFTVFGGVGVGSEE